MRTKIRKRVELLVSLSVLLLFVVLFYNAYNAYNFITLLQLSIHPFLMSESQTNIPTSRCISAILESVYFHSETK